MVKEILTPDRINIVDSVADWREAIILAAQPILHDGSIEQRYIDDMISSLEQHGPYIVLADLFALPHAGGEGTVHRVSMSLLQVTNEVDLLGKPVNIFLVLATPDSNSHLGALSQLMELLYDQSNLDILAKGTKEQILALVSKI